MMIVDGPWISVTFDSAHDLVELVFRRFTPSEQLRQILEKVRTSLEPRVPTRWLCDLVQARVLASHDVAWIVDEWLPLPCSSPSRVAMVDSIDALGRRSTARLCERLRAARPALAVSVFTQRGPARSWLGAADVTAAGGPA
jgi:hypothetical protein